VSICGICGFVSTGVFFVLRSADLQLVEEGGIDSPGHWQILVTLEGANCPARPAAKDPVDRAKVITSLGESSLNFAHECGCRNAINHALFVNWPVIRVIPRVTVVPRIAVESGSEWAVVRIIAEILFPVVAAMAVMLMMAALVITVVSALAVMSTLTVLTAVNILAAVTVLTSVAMTMLATLPRLSCSRETQTQSQHRDGQEREFHERIYHTTGAFPLAIRGIRQGEYAPQERITWREILDPYSSRLMVVVES
jgi:hypothetical protein